MTTTRTPPIKSLMDDIGTPDNPEFVASLRAIDTHLAMLPFTTSPEIADDLRRNITEALRHALETRSDS